MPKYALPLKTILGVQAICLTTLGIAVAFGKVDPRPTRVDYLTGQAEPLSQPIPRSTPLVIEPLYDDPRIASDEELADVLRKLQPRFPKEKLRPNLVEHALRTWWIRAKFQDPEVMSGEAMKDYLTDHGKYLASWGGDMQPLLSDREAGVSVRWGKAEGASVHHDHWLACLTEAGIGLDEPVFTPNRERTIADVLHQSLSDFRVDETEVEWSAMAFGLWLAPIREWRLADGRQVSFDDLADRLMRGDNRFGVCSGTHRLYSLAVLLRLDMEFDILSDRARGDLEAHLREIRDLIAVSQREDGRWTGTWAQGAAAATGNLDEPLYKQIIATGHHLEWMAIVPEEFHVPREQMYRAADWLITTTRNTPDEQILGMYTFFSHVANSLSLWRKTHPCDFWAKYEAENAPVSAAAVVGER